VSQSKQDTLAARAALFLEFTPGSAGAVAHGCSCPAAENSFGRGRVKGGVVEASFAADPECPVHALDIILAVLPANDGDPS
jgi:hypothetical protein